MSLIFKKIKNAEVFTSDFVPMTINNEIRFPRSEKICVLYGPNGTGKTSLSKVLSGAPETELEFELDGTNYTSDSGLFHVVSDQNNRNIISGETRDFFLGDNIRHEFELQDKLAEKREEFLAAVIAILNANGIKASKSPLLDLISNSDLREFFCKAYLHVAAVRFPLLFFCYFHHSFRRGLRGFAPDKLSAAERSVSRNCNAELPCLLGLNHHSVLILHTPSLYYR